MVRFPRFNLKGCFIFMIHYRVFIVCAIRKSFTVEQNVRLPYSGNKYIHILRSREISTPEAPQWPQCVLSNMKDEVNCSHWLAKVHVSQPATIPLRIPRNEEEMLRIRERKYHNTIPTLFHNISNSSPLASAHWLLAFWCTVIFQRVAVSISNSISHGRARAAGCDANATGDLQIWQI